MRKYRNLTLIGTSHIASESIKEVEKTIKNLQPKIVALELDRIRAHALLSNKKRRIRLKDIREIGGKGFLFNILGAFIPHVIILPRISIYRRISSFYNRSGPFAKLLDYVLILQIKNYSIFQFFNFLMGA